MTTNFNYHQLHFPVEQIYYFLKSEAIVKTTRHQDESQLGSLADKIRTMTHVEIDIPSDKLLPEIVIDVLFTIISD